MSKMSDTDSILVHKEIQKLKDTYTTEMLDLIVFELESYLIDESMKDIYGDEDDNDGN